MGDNDIRNFLTETKIFLSYLNLGLVLKKMGAKRLRFSATVLVA